MIPRIYFRIAHPFPLHLRAEKVFQKISLFFSRIDTRLPCLRRHRFVLNCNAPDRYALSLICLDEPGVVVRPRLIKLRLQFSTVKHTVVVLHECWRTPGAGEKSEFVAGSSQRLFDKWNAKSFVVIDAEGLQLLV